MNGCMKTLGPWALALALSVGLLGCGAQRDDGPGRDSPPDLVVLVLIDTLRADALGLYGHPVDDAPRLSALARQGVLFERVIAPSSWTKTSMASILTARDPGAHGVRRVTDVLPEELTTLAEAFADAHWATLGVNTNPWLKPRFGFEQGFERYETAVFADAPRVVGWGLQLLDEQRGGDDRPTFLSLHLMDVHAPYTPPREVFDAPPLRVPGLGRVPDAELEQAFRKQGLRAPGVAERVRALYQAELAATDRALGVLLDGLEQRGLSKRALIVVTADHGEAFGEHGSTEHGSNLYPEVLQVPLVLWSPGRLPAGLRVSAQVRSIDVAPTLLALAAIPTPTGFQGLALPGLDGAPAAGRTAQAAVGLNDGAPDHDFRAVVTRDALYIHDRLGGGVEFYDLRTDPGAGTDLGAAHPGAAAAARLESQDDRASEGEAPLDAETREHLRALGYLDDDG